MDALVGHTGFIGATLMRQVPFGALFNSINIDSMRGGSYGTVVCAGARAEKWKANRDPVEDRKGIDKLCSVLSTVRAERFVLISTVDVFSDPDGVDELSRVGIDDLHPYGLNRRALEIFVAERFAATILRLPGVYGPGLRKNVIYDLIHRNEVEKIDSRSVFQFYGVDRLSADIERALARRLPLLHLATEPLSVGELASVAFELDFVNEVVSRPPRYDVRTRYAPEFGSGGRYMEDKASVLRRVARFVRDERAVPSS